MKRVVKPQKTYRPRWVGQRSHIVVAGLLLLTVVLIPIAVIILVEQFVLEEFTGEFDEKPA